MANLGPFDDSNLTPAAAAAASAPTPAPMPRPKPDVAPAPAAAGSRPTFRVRGNKDEWDTVDTIATAWLAANPNSGKKHSEVVQEIIDLNHLKDAKGRDCKHRDFTFPNIHPHQLLQLPEGNALGDFAMVRGSHCAPIVSTPPDEPAVPHESRRPLYQLIPTPTGMVNMGMDVDAYNFYFGHPPVDVAAEYKGDRDRVDSRGVHPNNSEGTLTRKDSLNFEMDRRTYGELTYGPQQSYFPETRQPNTRFNQKIEQNSRWFMDANGNVVSVVDMNALISINRRLNPYYAGIFSDELTARNVINQWNNTGEGEKIIAAYAGIQNAYPIVADRFFHGNPDTAAQDAEALLQMNVKTALSPLIWSVSSQGVPVGNAEVLKEQMQKVLSSSNLSAADRAQLEAKYKPMMAVLNEPVALDRLTGGKEGRANWIHALRDVMLPEREQNEYIHDHYSDRPDGRDSKEDRNARVHELGIVYDQMIEDAGFHAPTDLERLNGQGKLFSTQRQDAQAMSEARIRVLEHMRSDPELRARVIDQVLNNPGALQNWTDPMLYATRTDEGSPTILGFKPNDGGMVGGLITDVTGWRGHGSDVRHFVRDTAANLAGEKYRNEVEFDTGNIVENSILRPIGKVASVPAYAVDELFGTNINNSTHFYNPFGGRNQNRGLIGFQEAALARWNDEGTRGQVDQGFNALIDRAIEAERRGNSTTATSLLLSVNPNWDEDRNNGHFSENYARLIKAAGREDFKTITDQTVVNFNDVGNVAAGMEAKLEGDVARGDRKSNETGLFNTRGVEGLSGPALAQRLATANSPNLATQGEVNRNVVSSLSTASPAMFSLLVTLGRVDPRAHGTEKGQLGAMLDSLEERSMANSAFGLFGSTQSGTYAKLIQKHADAIRAAGDDPVASNRAINAAVKDFTSFFADEKNGKERTAAASLLSHDIEGAPAVTSLFTSQYNAVAVDNAGAYLESLRASGKLSKQDIMALSALQATTDVKARMAGFEEFLAGHNALNDTWNAKPGWSVIETLKIVGIIVGVSIPNPPGTPGMPPVTPPQCLPGMHVPCM